MKKSDVILIRAGSEIKIIVIAAEAAVIASVGIKVIAVASFGFA